MQQGSDKDFEVKVQAYILFFREIGERKAAEFCVNQDYAIYGLTKNNESFVAAYRKSAQQSVHPTLGIRAAFLAFVNAVKSSVLTAFRRPPQRG